MMDLFNVTFACLVMAPMYSIASMGYMIAHGARRDTEDNTLRHISIGFLVGSIVIFTLGVTQ